MATRRFDDVLGWSRFDTLESTSFYQQAVWLEIAVVAFTASYMFSTFTIGPHSRRAEDAVATVGKWQAAGYSMAERRIRYLVL